MSVNQLEARIQELSADIDRQREVLRKLEHSKMARLPFDISSDIFIQCLPPRPHPGAHHNPMLLLNICNAWTEIAIATPALWVAIHVVFPRANGFHEVLGTWLERARSHSLSISLHGNFDDAVATVVRQHTEHLKRLEILADGGNGFPSITPLPSLEAFTLGSLPSLDYGYSTFTDSQIVEFLRHTPNLVEWTLDNIRVVHMKREKKPGQKWTSLKKCRKRERKREQKRATVNDPIGISDVPGTPLALALSSLRYLSFGTAEGGYSDTSIIKYLSLPALEILSLSLSTDIPDFSIFLRRSLPPLRKLAVGVYALHTFTLQFQQQIVASLCLLSSLTYLELDDPDSDTATAIFTALLSDPSVFLPNLRSMKIGRLYERLSDDSYEVLIRVLSIRRAQLVCFELKWGPFSSARASEPDAHLVESFRQFVAEGMEIHIGTKDLNLITSPKMFHFRLVFTLHYPPTSSFFDR
ncbi:hypothetical protein DFH09DRAFT_1089395 [Mycena vulgaris]|nr:hypothetical protein DFH09DRAFT_1089395 [Mycena vulgaris]